MNTSFLASNNSGRDLEVLILTKVSKDAELTASILGRAGFRTTVVPDVRELAFLMPDAGAVILSEECLSTKNIDVIQRSIKNQPPWSDVPFIAVAGGGTVKVGSNERLEKIAGLFQNVTSNLTVLERPIRLATLLTVVRSAISSRKKQFELRNILEDLEKSKLAAEQANQAKSSFLANMSHEIRTPLGAIIGFTELMRDPEILQEDRQRFSDIVARNGEQLSSLINDVLDLSKIEAGKVELENVAFSLPDFLTDLSKLLKPMVEKRNLIYSLDIQKKLPAFVITDATRIRQILVNLVSNAVKFTPRGTVSLRVSIDQIHGKYVRLKFDVTDTGIGMNDIEKQRLFSPFSQADASTTRRFGGTGLGLALSKRLANALGGELLLTESAVGVGSRFTATVMVEVVPTLNDEEQPPKIKDNALASKNILLVEDSADNQLLIQLYLGSAGAKVTISDNGKTAVDMAMKNKFDLVLMDVQMPIMDGLTATRELRRRHYTVPILALTAHALSEERDRSLAAGCNDHLSKPINRDLLVEKILQFC